MRSFSLSDSEAARGVVTHSSGNHGQQHSPCSPNTRDSSVHRDASQLSSGEERSSCRLRRKDYLLRANARSARNMQERLSVETGATIVHPYNNYHVITGQGTATLELLQEIPDLDAIVAPVGGAGS